MGKVQYYVPYTYSGSATPDLEGQHQQPSLFIEGIVKNDRNHDFKESCVLSQAQQEGLTTALLILVSASSRQNSVVALSTPPPFLTEEILRNGNEHAGALLKCIPLDNNEQAGRSLRAIWLVWYNKANPPKQGRAGPPHNHTPYLKSKLSSFVKIAPPN